MVLPVEVPGKSSAGIAEEGVAPNAPSAATETTRTAPRETADRRFLLDARMTFLPVDRAGGPLPSECPPPGARRHQVGDLRSGVAPLSSRVRNLGCGTSGPEAQAGSSGGPAVGHLRVAVVRRDALPGEPQLLLVGENRLER